eukprot:GHVS01097919.1.p2 GENE.GHVS01097919.1~~GHVS01097919.1.p2  ORF type:complete len:121 (+),score=13.54 GHVS01097919.1:349-711(+)
MVVEAIIALDRFPGHSHGRLNSAIRQGFSSGAGDGTADRGLGGKVAESKGSQQNGSVGGNTGQPKSKAAPSTGGMFVTRRPHSFTTGCFAIACRPLADKLLRVSRPIRPTQGIPPSATRG